MDTYDIGHCPEDAVKFKTREEAQEVYDEVAPLNSCHITIVEYKQIDSGVDVESAEAAFDRAMRGI